MGMASTENLSCDPLQPSNLSGPSYRPRQSSGCTTGVRQGGPGAGEGQPTCIERDPRRSARAEAEVQAKAQRIGAIGPMCASACSDAVRAAEHLRPGCACACPVRRAAHPLRSSISGGTLADRTPSPVAGAKRPLGPVEARRWSRLCPCPVSAPSARALFAPSHGAAATGRQPPRRPL
jgi:hypothetical protein